MIIKEEALGAVVAWLSDNNTGTPLDVIRVDAVSQFAVAHGCDDNEQPVMAKGGGCRTIGCPETVTFWLVIVGLALP